MTRHSSGRALLLALVALTLVAADWPRFRGPGGQGVSDETGLPAEWSDSENLVWKTALPGFGASSPITVGDRIFVTSYAGYGLDEDEPGEPGHLKHYLTCINRNDGKVIWSRGIEPRLPELEYRSFLCLHGYGSATPASDGQTVFAFFGKSGVVAFNLEGKPLWRAYVGEGLHDKNWGTAASPILHEDLLILNASVESGSVVALDKATGDEVWRTEGIEESWSTPLVVEVPDGPPELVVSVREKVFGLDPASGEKLWECASLGDWVCPSVIAHDGIIYVSASGRPLTIAIRAGGRGDVTETHRLWEQKKTPVVATPVYHNGHLYWLGQRGIAVCINAEDGEVVYQERPSFRIRDKVYASGVLADGKIYYVTRKEGILVVKAGPEFEELAHNQLDDESVFNATPAISNGRLLIRSDRFLYCIGK